MRIISGQFKGRKFHPPRNLPVRPTTDFAKEGLFNILGNMFDIEGAKVLDLCAGSGNISFEFASRNAKSVICIDQNINCIKYIKKQADSFRMNNISTFKSDLFLYLKRISEKHLYDIIFTDPPYGLKETSDLPQIILSKDLLRKNGLLIIEHGKEFDFKEEQGFQFSRTYGNVNFTFFKSSDTES